MAAAKNSFISFFIPEFWNKIQVILKSFEYQRFLGEMSELAEGARLEIVCAVKSGTEGSNPSLSAIIKKNA